MTLTAVRGVAVGHATDREAATGCTVVLGPFRAAVDVRGLASGTRQLDSLTPGHLVSQVDALLFTGGSAYGLAAADGVALWLEETGRGFEVGVGRVTIVPTAAILDLGRGRVNRRPDAAMGRAACEAASDAPVEEGRVGAGTGATVGKLLGAAGSMPGGVGSAATALGDHRIGALAVVNAFGDVLSARGAIIAGARDEHGAFVDSAAFLREKGAPVMEVRGVGSNTTLAVVATDYALTRTELGVVARQGMNAVVRRIAPVNTQFDGDIVFACSTGPDPAGVTAAELLRIGLCAEWALAEAIERAVTVSGAGDKPVEG